ISIRDSELTDIDSVTYSSELGAKGDGNTLYYTGSKWSFGSPTPGSGSLVADSNSINQKENLVNNNSSSNTNITLPMKKISAHIINSEDDNMVVTVGADSLFKGRAVGFSGDVISGARFQWSFGDGGKGEGKSILYYYKYPGKYIVVLNVSSGEYSSTDRILVSAIPADVFIANADKDKIELINKSDSEVNLSWWIFKVRGDSFIIPENTIILQRQSIIFSSEITGLHPNKVSDVSFLYPNGSVVSSKPEYNKITHEDKKVSETQKNKTRILPPQSIVGKDIHTTQINENVSIKKPIEAEVDAQINNQSANVSKAIDIKEKNKSIFWFSLIGIILLGSFSVIVLRRKSRGEIKIIE
ncbi:MAG TPA: PKD domain-containing protein, partial [Ignavibacteria bacterium]|nr:PKD domain-containing protein [Ignavibacteria bacterium]